MTAPMSTPDATGTVLAGRYELRSVIGRGGHGLVWHADDRSTGRPVAVKMLNDVAAQDPQIIERLKREQQALLALAGTNAVGFVDLCRTPGGKLCLVMELLQGIDLEQRLEHLEALGEKISVAELLAVLGPIVETLERAHQAGILHRDLKPANIFIMSPAAGGGVRLLDFGLARLRSAAPLTAAGMIVGSPSYIAPEVWKGRPEGLDQRVDVYAFGVTVFRALGHRLPFEGVTLKDKFRLTTTAPRPSLRALRGDLPEAIDDWVSAVLAIEPEQRFDHVRSAWNALLSAVRAPERGGMWAITDLPRVDQLPEAQEPASVPAPTSTRTLRSTLADGGAVRIAPVVAVLGDPSQLADDKKSFVREWLAGSELAPSADPADVASWLGVPEGATEPSDDLQRPVRTAPKPPRRKAPAKKPAKSKPQRKAKAKAKAKSKARAKPKPSRRKA